MRKAYVEYSRLDPTYVTTGKFNPTQLRNQVSHQNLVSSLLRLGSLFQPKKQYSIDNPLANPKIRCFGNEARFLEI